MAKTAPRNQKARQVEPKRSYPIAEAIALMKKLKRERFDASVEVHIRLGIDPKKSEQLVRTTVLLPNSIGKSARVAVFAEGEAAAAAKQSGADVVGGKELVDEIKMSGKADFDVAVATPDMMRQMAVIAKVLGPKGLMPTPKNETVTPNVSKAVAELKKGKVSLKNDDGGNIHQLIGKVSFPDEQLLANYDALLDAIRRAKPSSSKGTFLRSITIASAMGPGIRVNIS